MYQPVGKSRVALRKESVDRNIKITKITPTAAVALRKESVDRNFHRTVNIQRPTGRSPQGERG